MKWEGDDKKEEGGWQNNKEKEWTDAILRATWKQNNIHGVCNMFTQN